MAAKTRTRSFPCPDPLWREVERFARARGLGAPAAAARHLLRSGLSLERRTVELDAARDWQIEQAWADVQSIASGVWSTSMFENPAKEGNTLRSPPAGLPCSVASPESATGNPLGVHPHPRPSASAAMYPRRAIALESMASAKPATVG